MTIEIITFRPVYTIILSRVLSLLGLILGTAKVYCSATAPSLILSNTQYPLGMTYDVVPPGHNPLADDPPVAAVESGGPNEGPRVLIEPKQFQYEVSGSAAVILLQVYSRKPRSNVLE